MFIMFIEAMRHSARSYQELNAVSVTQEVRSAVIKTTRPAEKRHPAVTKTFCKRGLLMAGLKFSVMS
jgi:hypothetical protein